MGKYDPLKPRLDVQQAMTAKFVERIEQGSGEFQMPWHRPGLSFAIPKNALASSRACRKAPQHALPRSKTRRRAGNSPAA